MLPWGIGEDRVALADQVYQCPVLWVKEFRMRANLLMWVLAAVVICGFSNRAALADKNDGFHLAIGVTYASGLYDVSDKLKKGFELEGYDVDRWVWPVGLSLTPYYEFNFGLGIGGSVGPVSAGFIDKNHDSYDEKTDNGYFVIIPVGLDLRYTLFRNGNVSPYVRAGARYPIVTGDFVSHSQIGPFGAIGVEFFRSKAVQLGFEVGWDGSKLDVKVGDYKKSVQPGQLLATVFVAF